MTTRLKGLTVTLERDIREDDAEWIINAIKMIKGIQSVDVIKENADDYINRMRIRRELEQKIYDALKD